MRSSRHATAYRALLLEALADRCQRNPRYSQRAFARDLGLAPHRVSEILRGRQGLSRRSAELVAKRLGLDSATRRIFCDRVAAAHGRSAAEREAAATRLRRLDGDAKERKDLEAARFKAIAEWQHLALLEALKLQDCLPTETALAQRLALAPAQVRAAMTRLETLGLVRRAAAADGERWTAVDDVTVGGEVPSAAVRAYHDQYLAKARDALVLQPFGTRAFNTAVVAIDRRRLPELKRRLEEFLESLVDELSAGPDATKGADTVYALQMHTYRIDRDPSAPEE